MNFSEELLDLIKEGESEMVIQLLEDSSLYHSTDDQGVTLLHYSAQHNNVNVAKYLLDKGCDVDIQDKEGITPLMISVTQDETDVTKILLSAGADIFKLNNKRMSAFRMLSKQRQSKFDIVELFFEKLKKKCSTVKEIVEKLMDAGYHFYHALLLKDNKIIEYMLQSGIPVDSVNPLNKFTALHVAVLLDDFKSVCQLLQFGANVNALNIIKANCLYYLYDTYQEHNNEKIKILEILLNRGASMTSCMIDGIFQVSPTLISGNRAAIHLLIDAGLNFKINDVELNRNVLHYLAMNCNAGLIEELKHCTKQLTVNALDKLRQSPLMVAVRHGNVDMVKFLLEQGARTDIVNNISGITVLYYAYNYTKPNLEYQYHQCGEMLLEYNADPQFLADKNGEPVTIFDAALKNNDAERMKPVVAHLAVLEKLGIEINKTIWDKINSHPLLKKYFHKCKQLLTQKASEHVMFFNLLTSDKSKMAKYLNNENIVKKFKNKSYERKMANYGYYYNILNRRYIKGKRFRKLKDKAARFICKIFEKRIDKKHLIVENVIKYLNDQSLHQLSQLYRQSSCRRLFQRNEGL